MPFSPAELHLSARVGLQRSLKSACQKIDELILKVYKGQSPAYIQISATEAWIEPLLFEMIKTEYAKHGWDVTKRSEHGDQRDPYTIHYLVFQEVPNSNYDSREHGVCGGMGYGGNDR